MVTKVNENKLIKILAEEIQGRLEQDNKFNNLKSNSRPLSILIDSLKSKIRFVRPNKLPDESPLKSGKFRMFASNIDKIVPVFNKILKLLSHEMNEKEHVRAMCSDNEWQIDGDNRIIFTDFSVEYKDESGEQVPIRVTYDRMDSEIGECVNPINEKIANTHCHISVQRVNGERIIVTLSTPWNFNEYNNEIEKCMQDD